MQTSRCHLDENRCLIAGMAKNWFQKHLLSFAFGPGLTLESAVLTTHMDA